MLSNIFYFLLLACIIQLVFLYIDFPSLQSISCTIRRKFRKWVGKETVEDMFYYADFYFRSLGSKKYGILIKVADAAAYAHAPYADSVVKEISGIRKDIRWIRKRINRVNAATLYEISGCIYNAVFPMSKSYVFLVGNGINSYKAQAAKENMPLVLGYAREYLRRCRATLECGEMPDIKDCFLYFLESQLLPTRSGA